MMQNPFELFDKRLENIENILLDLKHEPKETFQVPELEKPLTVDAAAEFLGLSIATIYTKNSKGELPSIKNAGSKRLYFLKSDLIEYLKTGRKKTVRENEIDAEKYLNKKAVTSFQ